MSSSGSDGFGDYRSQVLGATNIVDLIGRTVALKRVGGRFWGLCPFHQEKTPSFTVNADRQSFYCYGCKANGSAIDFVMQRDRLAFLEALNQLGQQAGIERPEGRGGFSKEKASEKQLILEAQSAACAFFENSLAHPEQGSAAREYIKGRGFGIESIKRFQIGLAPDEWEALVRSPLMRKFKPEVLALAGLAKPRGEGKGCYDLFRNRLMFPIRDENGRVIGFGGRKMAGSPDEAAKYINSPDTPVFSKKKNLFGLDLARQKIVETRTAVVVEGYTDVVMAHQFGASNVVSPLGTSLTDQQLTLLRRFAERIVLLFDADSAGDTAVDRLVAQFVTQPVEIAIAHIDAGLDPDEYLLKNGLKAFEKLVADAPDALEYKWRQLSRRLNQDSSSVTGRQKAIDAYLTVLAGARKSGQVDNLRWGPVLERVKSRTGIPVEQLRLRLDPPPKAGPGRSMVGGTTRGRPAAAAQPAGLRRESPPARLAARDRAERWILGILLTQPNRWEATKHLVGVKDFTDERRRRLAELYWDHQRDLGEPVFNEFLAHLAEAEAESRAGEPAAGANPDLRQLAFEVVDEIDALQDPDAVLSEALVFLEEDRKRREELKLQADVRRTDGQMSDQDEVALIRKLQEKARQPDLRRS